MTSKTDWISAVIVTAFAAAVAFALGYSAQPTCLTGHDIDGMIQQKLNDQPTTTTGEK